MKNNIVVIFSSHLSENEDNNFKNHITSTIGCKHNIFCVKNYNEKSLAEVYNSFIKLNNENFETLPYHLNTIYVLCHNDILFKTKNWGKILLSKFNTSNYGIIGVAGSTFIPENGIWWGDFSKAYGIVEHTDNLNDWTTMFSKPINNIQSVVTIDGVFMAIDVEKIKCTFDEEFGKFHYYDLNFCLNNYIEGVDIGVITDIRILHKSVGETNNEWEENRVKFIKKFGDYLPIKYVSEDKLKVLIACYSFSQLTGSELANFELAKELVKLGCEVTVIAGGISDIMVKKSKNAGFKVFDLIHAPNYRITTDNKYEFVINEIEFDIIHVSHKPIANIILQLYPNTSCVMQIHSEVIPILEEPLIHPAIKKYLSIRDSVTDYIKTFGIEEENIISVDNPFDLTRFNTNYTVKENQKRIVLFVGTVDYLRIKMLEDLAKITQDSNQILWIVGKDNEDRLVEIKKQSNVTYFGETDKVEDYIKECDITAGIFKGRTTIEGWLCGKPAWIYYVNRNGNILSKSMGVEVPTDLERYSGKNVAQKMLNIYNEIL
jgi:hypothetical protein